MLDTMTLTTTAFAICGAFIIGLSSGAAQASVAEENLIGQFVEGLPPSSSESRYLKEVYRRKQREDREREWRGIHRHDYQGRHGHDYETPSPPRR